MSLDRHGPVLRDYRRARRVYGLTARDAFQYARDRADLRRSDLAWTTMPDDGDLAVYVYDPDTDDVLDVVGGIGVAWELSDHGNVLVDDHHPYLVALAAEMVRDMEATR